MKNINKNYNVLTIETSSNICGVSLICNDKVVYEQNLDKGLNHSVVLFDNITAALKKKQFDMSDIDVIKVSNGPGSYTGIRIGVASALGLSEKHNTKIEYVDTLDSLAYNVLGKNDIIISMMDAKNDRVYMSLYYSKKMKKVYKDYVVNVFDLCNLLNKYFARTDKKFSLVGSGAVNYKNWIDKLLYIDYKIYEKDSNLKASSLAFVKGEKSSAPKLNYLLDSKAEREKNGKH